MSVMHREKRSKPPDRLFRWFLRSRYRISRLTKEKYRMLDSAFLLTIILAIFLCGFGTGSILFACSAAMLVVPIGIASTNIDKALSSCRKFCSACSFLVLSPFIIQLFSFGSGHVKAAYIAATLLLVFLWFIIGGLADCDVAKTSFTILNSTTTIILLAVNVFVGWNATSEIGQRILYATNTAIFPFVAAGYATAGFKEIQLYWENHYWDKLPESEQVGLLPITAAIANPSEAR